MEICAYGVVMVSFSSAGRIDVICDIVRANRDGEPTVNVRIGDNDETRKVIPMTGIANRLLS
jgi:hypothetical protein